MKIAIYTVIFGDYDKLYNPEFYNRDIDYFCITDQKFNSSEWKILPEVCFNQPRFYNRLYKINPFKFRPYNFLEDYDYVIYIDGNLHLIGDFTDKLEDWMEDRFMGAGAHPQRNCIYKEARACIEFNKDNYKTILKQMEHYKNRGYPINNGLYDNSFLVRKPTIKCQEVCEMWLQQVIKFSFRDQLSLKYVLWKMNQEIATLPISPRENDNKYIRVVRHAKR